jgi:hypothetical protein
MNAMENSVSSEPVEAVIISGPQRGKIVRLDGQPAQEEPPREEIDALNDSLDKLIVKLDRVSSEIRAAIVTMKTPSSEKS